MRIRACGVAGRLASIAYCGDRGVADGDRGRDTDAGADGATDAGADGPTDADTGAHTGPDGRTDAR